MDRAFVGLACLFQVASAQTTYAGAEEFLTKSLLLGVTLTFVIQASLVFSGERTVAILSGRQKNRTSILPALLLLLTAVSTSILFSGFGFYKHYAYAEGNRVNEFVSTAAEVRRIAIQLDQYRVDILTFAVTRTRSLEEEARRQEARASNPRLSVRARAVARNRRDQLHRDIVKLEYLDNTLQELNVVASTSQPTSEMMRLSLLDSRNKIIAAVSNAEPDYLLEYPLPSDIPTAHLPADLQSGFKRDLEQRHAPAVFSLIFAAIVDLGSLLSLFCNVYVSPTELRILSAKRKLKRTWKAVLPLGETHDSFSVVHLQFSGLKERSEFRVVFNKPDWAVLGSDLEAAGAALSEEIGQDVGKCFVVTNIEIENGQEIVPDLPLFEQLAGRSVVLVQTGEVTNCETPD